jgi:hypothetical protein
VLNELTLHVPAWIIDGQQHDRSHQPGKCVCVGLRVEAEIGGVQRVTIAVCAKCGTKKIGALTPCPACAFTPGQDAGNDDDLYAMILSDHYFSAEQLDAFSDGMLAGAPRPKLSAVQEAEFRDGYRTANASLANSWWRSLFRWK